MSRSNPTAKNPATCFMRWRGGEDGGGRVTYYDKETQEEVEVKLPFSFIVLDELTTLTGFNDNIKQGYWSNEVRKSDDTLVLRNKNGIVDRGTYQEIKAKNHSGMKFAQSVCIAFKDDSGELVIGNIKLFGAAFSAWIDFKKKFDVMKCAVLLSGAKAAKKGTTDYFIPIFEGQQVSAETDSAAGELDKVVQSYLGTYLSRRPDDDDNSEIVDEPEEEVEVETVAPPAEKTPTTAPEVAAPAKPQPPRAVPANGGDDEKINLADVPF